MTAEEAFIFPITTQTILFQVLLLLASLYYGMLMTNWGDPTLDNDKSNFYEANWASFSIKLTGLFFSMLLYLFSLIAPKICKGRDFI